MHIALVGCAQTKRPGSHPAKDLYDSTLFRFAFAYALHRCERVFILSAKYGLLHPDTVIAHYDVALADMSVENQVAWGNGVFRQVEEVATPGDDLHFLCGSLYRSALPKEGLQRFTCHIPLLGKPIGKQLQWYKQNIPA